MLALIQAGGAGTRLKSITGDLPKPMVKIGGKPILEWQVASLLRSGIDEIIIVISTKGEAIPSYFGDGSKFGAKISYITETSPLGSGGALCYLKGKVDDDFVLCFGDLMLDVDWKRMIAFHKGKNAKITCFAHPNAHPFDSDLLVTDKEDRVTSIDSKNNTRDYYYKNLTNAGLYILSKDVLESIGEPRKIDFEKDVVRPAVDKGGVYAYRSSEYVKDCGTPDRYASVSEDLANGIISAKNLSNLQKAIFLDRDGTINVFGDFVTRAEMLSLAPTAAEAIRLIDQSQFLPICITNQPVIARGETTFAEMDRIHDRMEDLLGAEGAYLTDLFFCPHHPDSGFKGEVKELKIVCDCRKPKIGLLLKAKEKYNIDLSSSWFIGDTKQDVQTGINAGCRTVLLTTGDPRPNKNYAEAEPTFTTDTLLSAVRRILKEN